MRERESNGDKKMNGVPLHQKICFNKLKLCPKCGKNDEKNVRSIILDFQA